MSLRKKTKEYLSFILRLGLSAVLLTYLFHKIDLKAMRDALGKADLSYIFLSGLVFLFINAILLFRWFIYIKALNLKVPLSRIISCFFIGLFFNLFLPTSTGGDIMKIWYLFKDTSHKAKAVASVVADRLCGFVSIVLVALVAFVFGYRLLNDNSLFLMIVILGVLVSSIILVLFHEKTYSFCCRIFGRWHSIKERLMNFHYTISLLKNKGATLFLTVALSMFSQCCLALSFYLIARALHQDVPFIYFLIFVPIICVLSSLPSIGGLGFRDAGAAYLFAKVGMPSYVAVSISLTSFFFMAVVGLIGGVFYVIALSPGRIQYYKADSELSAEET